MSSNNVVALNEDRPSLSQEELAAATQSLVSFPQVVKSMADAPIHDQGLALQSFMLFAEPKMLNGKKLYGYVKNRGNYPGNPSDTRLANAAAQKIIKEQDSKFQIRIAPVGVWVPITEDDSVIREKTDVRMDEKEIHLRDEAIREKQAKDRAEARALKERADEVAANDIYDDQNSLEFYVMKRVVDFTLFEHIETQLQKLEDIRGKLEATRNILLEKQKLHPEYSQEWLDRYNVERRKAGVPDFVPSERTTNAYYEWLAEHGVIRPLSSTEVDAAVAETTSLLSQLKSE